MHSLIKEKRTFSEWITEMFIATLIGIGLSIFFFMTNDVAIIFSLSYTFLTGALTIGLFTNYKRNKTHHN